MLDLYMMGILPSISMKIDIVGTWNSGCINDEYGDSEIRIMIFDNDGNASYDDKAYFGVGCDPSYPNSDHTDSSTFMYEVKKATKGLKGEEAFELDTIDSDGPFYTMIRF